MRILIPGATGRTGKLVLKRALEKGYEVNCLARNTSRIEKGDGLTVFEGSPNNDSDFINAVSGCEAVIGVLNISRTSDFPWASLRTPKTFLSDVMTFLVPIAENQGVNRISICSALRPFQFEA